MHSSNRPISSRTNKNQQACPDPLQRRASGGVVRSSHLPRPLEAGAM
jgi:hypothetical protein